MGIFGKVANFAKKVVGSIGPPIKKIGTWVKDYHPHIALAAHGLAEASGNKTLQNITGVGLLASGVASGLGYGGKSPIMPDKVG